MRILLIGGLLVVGILPFRAMAGDEQRAVTPEQLTWAASGTLPKGAEVAVLFGDPSKQGAYVTRLRVPAGYQFPAHSHPNDENVTVISGTFNIGLGEVLDESKGKTLKAGGFVRQPRETSHYAWVTEDTVIQLHGIGPQGITYIDPADDPRN